MKAGAIDTHEREQFESDIPVTVFVILFLQSIGWDSSVVRLKHVQLIHSHAVGPNRGTDSFSYDADVKADHVSGLVAQQTFLIHVKYFPSNTGPGCESFGLRRTPFTSLSCPELCAGRLYSSFTLCHSDGLRLGKALRAFYTLGKTIDCKVNGQSFYSREKRNWYACAVHSL